MSDPTGLHFTEPETLTNDELDAEAGPTPADDELGDWSGADDDTSEES